MASLHSILTRENVRGFVGLGANPVNVRVTRCGRWVGDWTEVVAGSGSGQGRCRATETVCRRSHLNALDDARSGSCAAGLGRQC